MNPDKIIPPSIVDKPIAFDYLFLRSVFYHEGLTMDNDKFVLALAHVPLKVTMCKTSTRGKSTVLAADHSQIHPTNNFNDQTS